MGSSQAHRLRFAREPSNREDDTIVLGPTITGNPNVGQVLTCSQPVVRNVTTGVTYGYQWYRGITAIGGATVSTYTVQAGDIGKVIACSASVTHTKFGTKHRVSNGKLAS